ncbi:N-acetylmuramic acid 6-phosphate etherase [Actinomycetospora termitidis]|uniref:N-acetylmuramic acid 6-phosphate etherase n=1 Tax=Actinomycetospora termitidis TaxID=3053470 RepID=A0ABT7M7Q4_9PSEU|nr:N-acetylmuramic acid 6-phosphate etherase [Actinomycetospora sp. Odt1-22]MDL5156697.1 N-acetylmuramic acid 6-phosphate etherase [Actinomycetospora sp. Odt1-22]
MSAVIAVDLGRSGARIAAADRRWVTTTGAGLGDPGGAAAVAAVVRAAVGPLPAGCTLAVGVPGALTRPDEAVALAEALTSGRDGAATAVVTSDVIAWHAGAFGGHGAGVVLAVGTGAVALGVDREGTVRRVDGRGLLLGDAGGGAWIGQAGLRAAVRALDGAGPRTALVDPARAVLAGRPSTPGDLAAFAPAVLEAAESGDPVAARIVEEAVTQLVATTRGAGEPVALVGGLATALSARLRAAGLTLVDGAGDALDGLLTLAADATTPHEPVVTRRRDEHVDGTGPAADTDRLTTEAVRPGSEELDALPTPDLVARLIEGQAVAPGAVAAMATPIAEAADALGTALRTGGRLVYTGAGTSGRLAVQDAAELPPTFGLSPDRAVALLAGGRDAADAAVEGAEDDDAAGRADLEEIGVGPRDVVVGVAASGRTPYVLGALAAAAERGATTVAVVNAVDSPVAALADVAIELVTGPEVLAGSTRLAAGTGQKIALNTLSTAALVRAGATYGPWMVGVRVTNAKLRRRAERIVRDATGVDADEARAALAAAGDDVATAVVALLAGLDGAAARDRLATAGSVRAAVSGRRSGAELDPAAGAGR